MVTWSHYGVLNTCVSSILYYTVATSGIVINVVSSPFRGKDMPAFDQHHLVEMYQKGTSNTQQLNNELEELDVVFWLINLLIAS